MEPAIVVADAVKEGSRRIDTDGNVQHHVQTDPNPDTYIVPDGVNGEAVINHPILSPKVRTDPFITLPNNPVVISVDPDIGIEGMVVAMPSVDTDDMDVADNVVIVQSVDRVEPLLRGMVEVRTNL